MSARFSQRTELWTDGRTHVVVWDNGHLCVYEQTEMVAWHAGPTFPWGDPPDALRERWNALVGWPADALDAAGAWRLVADGDSQRVVGPRAPERRLVDVRWDPDFRSGRPLHPPQVSAAAHLSSGALGTVCVDPWTGLVWCLDDGVALRLRGVGDEHYVHAVRVPGGFVVHETTQQRGGLLARVDDDGAVRHPRSLYGGSAPLFLRDGAVYGVLPEEGLFDDGASGSALCRLDPETMEAERIDLAVGDQHHLAGDTWAVTDGHTLVLHRLRAGAWQEAARLRAQTGDPTRLAGEPRIEVEPPSWRGRAGHFEVRTHLVNRGRNHTGLTLRFEPGAATVDEVLVGAAAATVADGEATLPHAPLKSLAPVPLVLRGRVLGPTALHVRAVGRTILPVDPERPRHEVVEHDLGRFQVRFEVDGGLTLRRADLTLALDPAWVRELSDAGVLDHAVPEPDLSRWLRRALTRCRVASIANDPDAVRETWLQMSARDRGPAARLPAYKLASGRHWEVGADEAAAVARALGSDHPLGAFARGGPFEVVQPDPLEGLG